MKISWVVSALFLLLLWACGREESLPPIPGEAEGAGGASSPGRAEPQRPAPQVAGLPQGPVVPASEPDLLPEGGPKGGGRLHVDPGGREHRIPWAVFTWPAAVEGVQKKLRLTTRPAGTGAWPWVTLEAWIPAKKGLKEWEGTRIAVNRVKYQEGPALALWPRAGECYLVLRKAAPDRLEADLHLEVMDPLHGVKRTVTGSLEAVRASGGAGKDK